VSEAGWYVYGVVDADSADGDPVRLIRSGSLAAIVAPVDLAEFGDIDEKLNDRAWIEQKALEHEAVLQRFAVGGAVVPLRFGAVYRRLDDVERLLAERRDEFAADLDRVRGCVELGVKAFVDRPELEERLSRERARAEDATPGRAYLERRRVERAVVSEAAGLLIEAARNAHARLLERSVAGVVSRPHSRELTGRRDDMVFNAAYLVPAADGSALRAEVEAIGRAYATLAVSFEVTGPWPPYSFVGRERQGPAG